MTRNEQMIAEIEHAAKLLGVSHSTAGALTGQNGMFYQRLKDGRRVWPETLDVASANLRAAVAERLGAKPAPAAVRGENGTVQS